MLGGTYSTGTISVPNNSVAVTGIDVLWNDVLEGDELWPSGSGAMIIGADVVHPFTSITLMKPWPGATLVGSTYVIVKTSWKRHDVTELQKLWRTLAADLEATGNFIFVEGDEPDPEMGENGQWALKTNVAPWSMWHKEFNVWVEQAVPVGGGDVIASNNLSEIPNDVLACANIGAVSKTNAIAVNAKEFGVDMTGATDSSAALSNALAAAHNTTGVLYVPPGIVKLNGTIQIPQGVSLIGSGMPHRRGDHISGSYPGSYPGEQDGTWFFFNHTGFGFLIQWGGTGANDDAAYQLSGFGTYRTQPPPPTTPPYDAAWTPGDHSYDFYIISSTQILISDVLLLNATRGFAVVSAAAASRGSGRIDFRRIYGQVFKNAFLFDYVYDVIRLSEIHLAPQWVATTGVMRYQSENLSAMVFGRCDNPQVDQFFVFAAKVGIQTFISTELLPGAVPGGSLSNAQFGLCQFDSCTTAIEVLAGSKPQMCFDQLICYAPFWPAPTNATLAFVISGTDADIRIGDLKSVFSGARHGVINGSGCRVRIGRLTTQVSDMNATGLAQFDVAGGNWLAIEGETVSDAAADKLVSGAGISSGNFWRSYAATLVSTGGTLGSTTVVARYRRIGETVNVLFDATITNNGTGSGALHISLPFFSHSDSLLYSAGTAREVAGAGPYAGKMATVTIAIPASNVAQIMSFDNQYFGATGARIGGNFAYRCAP